MRMHITLIYLLLYSPLYQLKVDIRLPSVDSLAINYIAHFQTGLLFIPEAPGLDFYFYYLYLYLYIIIFLGGGGQKPGLGYV